MEAVAEEEAYYRVPGKDKDEDHRRVEGVTMDVLQNERDVTISLVCLGRVRVKDGVGRRVQEEGAIIGQAKVVASEAEAEWEDKDIQGGRDTPDEDAPIEQQQWRIKRREIRPPIV